MAIAVITGVSAHAEAEIAAVLGAANGVDLVRRCADLAEVLAVAAAGRAEVALVSADLPGLDLSSVRELRDQGVRVIGVFADESQERTLREWGVSWLIGDRAAQDELLEQVHAAATTDVPRVAALPEEDAGSPAPNEQDEDGKVIAVWGTGGAPGRSVVAADLAVEFASAGEPTMLIDADTYGACQAQLFGVLDEAPGVAAATRLAEAGRLDTVSLAGLAPMVGERLRILTGLPRPDRWPEVRSAALQSVLETSKRMHRWTIVDIAAPTDLDEELSFDTVAPQRNMATRAVLDNADEVLVVAAGDPIGIGRLVRAIDEVKELTVARSTVVVTKVRASAAGRNPRQEIEHALQRFAGVEPVFIPDDRDALDAALLAGRALAETAPSSPAAAAIRALAHERMGLAQGRPARRGRGLRKRAG